MSASLTYGLGCPLWALADWEGGLYRDGSAPGDYLRQYATVFNAVEGNTTFYATPSPTTVARWMGQVPQHFRFCFKFPRTITHDLRLHDCANQVREFLHRLRPLQQQMGPLMVQLPASFGPASLPALYAFLESLPADFAYAVELRQRRFFEDERLSDEVDEQLRLLGVERVILDSRPLRAGDSHHPEVLAAQHAKPDLPVRPNPLTEAPIVRLITHPDPAVNEPWLEHWAGQICAWLRRGITPLLFMHCPDNRHSPGFARALHQRLEVVGAREGVGVGEMAAWPGESAPGATGADQLTLL